MKSKNRDYAHNANVFGGYWLHQGKAKRRLTYASQTKLRRFRHLLKAWHGIERRCIAVFDQGFGAGDMLLCFDPTCRIAGEELSREDVDAFRREAISRSYADVDVRVFRPGRELPGEWKHNFDFVISSHVLEHIEEPARSLRDLFRLLKPGGHACLVVPINEKPGDDENHFHWFTEESFCAMISSVGFEVVEARSVDRLWALLAPAFYRRQRRPRSIWRAIAIAQNLATSILPNPVLSVIDRFLAVLRVPPRQCFVLCRRPRDC